VERREVYRKAKRRKSVVVVVSLMRVYGGMSRSSPRRMVILVGAQ
jgi:hypothetical protein